MIDLNKYDLDTLKTMYAEKQDMITEKIKENIDTFTLSPELVLLTKEVTAIKEVIKKKEEGEAHE